MYNEQSNSGSLSYVKLQSAFLDTIAFNLNVSKSVLLILKQQKWRDDTTYFT